MRSVNTKNAWFNKNRNYLHFDKKISEKKAYSLVCNASKVASWNFFPFLSVPVTSRKIYRDEKDSLQKKDKIRKIMYAGHMDSNIYAYYASKLQKLYEKRISDCTLHTNILAFRKISKNNSEESGKCNIDFAKDIFDDIKSRDECVVLSFDVKAFFDKIDHMLLKTSWIKLLGQKKLPQDHFSIFKSLTSYSYVNRKKVFDTFSITKASKRNGIKRICSIKDFRTIVRKDNLIAKNQDNFGIPQGSPMSGLLSNLYLLEFDKMILNRTKAHGASYYRYCDDIIIICDQKAQAIFKLLVTFLLNELKLKTNEKTMVTTFTRNSKHELTCDKSLQYLGFMFDGRQTTIRSSSYARFLKKMRKAVLLASHTRRKYNKIREAKGLPALPLYKQKLYARYSYLGKRNFITYAHRAGQIMQEPKIKQQIKPAWNRLQFAISENAS